MIKPGLNCLVWYKGRPAIVAEMAADDKITITAIAANQGARDKKTETVKVREKDIEVLHPGPVKDPAALIESIQPESNIDQTLHDVWELIESNGAPVTLRELTELIHGEFTPKNAWAARLSLADGLYFSGTIDAVKARNAGELAAEKEKRQGKAKEGREREAFLERLRGKKLDPGDSRFIQDVEALACGKTDKSRTMKELRRTETPEEAHRLLLECRYWDKWVNPHSRRYGFTPSEQETHVSQALPAFVIDRQDLTRLRAFAIDSVWSNDPDDAISLEQQNGRRILYVHVADPAPVIRSDTPSDLEARSRGATLYLPEGTWPMLGGAMSQFALGINGTPACPASDNALTFKITLNDSGDIEDTEIIPSIINVTRLSYEEADRLIEETETVASLTPAAKTTPFILGELCRLAEANLERRLSAGAVHISLPEIHLSVAEHTVQILPIVHHRSAALVRECMLLAGEAAAAWAARRRIPFPYITQETGDLPAKPLPGLAGNIQLRRCMRPRSVSAKPGCHWGLGLDSYSQVTSPLRRYTDLLAHQQIYACLCKETGKSDTMEPLNEEEVLYRLAAGDAAAQAVTQAERASKAHWTAVYLDELLCAGTAPLWDAVVTEKRANGLGIIIPALGLETQIGGSGNLNDEIKVRFKSVKIPEPEFTFVTEAF